MKRRPNRRPIPAAVPAKPLATAAKTKPVEVVKEKETVKPKPEQKSNQSAAAKDFFGKGKEKSKTAAGSAPSSKEGTPAPPPALKRESSSIFKSFAKAKPKLKREDTESSATEDVPMKGVLFDDDDDDEEDAYVQPAPMKKGDGEEAGDRKTRKDREAALKRMMEDDDEDEVEAVPEPEPEEEETVLEKEAPVKEPEPEITVSGGRRRGKRRVMKKKTVKDEEGYLGMSRP